MSGGMIIGEKRVPAAVQIRFVFLSTKVLLVYSAALTARMVLRIDVSILRVLLL